MLPSLLLAPLVVIIWRGGSSRRGVMASTVMSLRTITIARIRLLCMTMKMKHITMASQRPRVKAMKHLQSRRSRCQSAAVDQGHALQRTVKVSLIITGSHLAVPTVDTTLVGAQKDLYRKEVNFRKSRAEVSKCGRIEGEQMIDVRAEMVRTVTPPNTDIRNNLGAVV